jgi:hypothetical protein
MKLNIISSPTFCFKVESFFQVFQLNSAGISHTSQACYVFCQLFFNDLFISKLLDPKILKYVTAQNNTIRIFISVQISYSINLCQSLFLRLLSDFSLLKDMPIYNQWVRIRRDTDEGSRCLFLSSCIFKRKTEEIIYMLVRLSGVWSRELNSKIRSLRHA